jgi:hypothetical protein
VGQTEEDVFRTDVVVVQHPRFFLGEDDHSPGSVGESLEHSSTMVLAEREEIWPV